MPIQLPPDFDVARYIRSNPDLAALSPAEALAHYAAHGHLEGRPCNAIDSRERFLELLPKRKTLLEIGPYTAPAFRRPKHNVRYLDAFTTEELRTTATATGADAGGVPDIDFVWRGEAYVDLVTEPMGAIFSSHNIEHQPDLIRHIQQLSDILDRDGKLFFIIPDRRYCFDHFLTDTNFADVLAAYYDERRRHHAGSVLEHALLTTHNDAPRHWVGDHGPCPATTAMTPGRVDALKQTMARIESTPGYIDTHAWQFTPDSFRLLIDVLGQAGLIPFQLERLYPTMRDNFEFYAVLRRKKP